MAGQPTARSLFDGSGGEINVTDDLPPTTEKGPTSSDSARAEPVSGERFAAALRGFGPVGIAAALLILLSGNVFVGNVVVPLGAVLVLLWARCSRTSWHEIGYVRQSWIGGLVIGIVLGVVLKFLMKAVVMPLLSADPINHAYHHLAGPDLDADVRTRSVQPDCAGYHLLGSRDRSCSIPSRMKLQGLWRVRPGYVESPHRSSKHLHFDAAEA